MLCLVESAVFVRCEELGLGHAATQFRHIQSTIMIDIELVELCRGGLVDFSEIKRPIVIGVPRGDGIRGAVCRACTKSSLKPFDVIQS